MAAPFSFDNLPDGVPRVYGGYIEENGAGVYNFDVFVPAGALIDDIGVHAEVLWAAATSAVLNVGDYLVTDTEPLTIGAAIDLDGFFGPTDLKATDLLANQSIDFSAQGAEIGAYGVATHMNERFSLVDRIIRFEVTSVGAGATGRTACWVKLLRPAWKTITQ